MEEDLGDDFEMIPGSPEEQDECSDPADKTVATTENGEAKVFFLPAKVVSALFRGKYMVDMRAAYMNRKLVIPAELDYLNDPAEWATFVHKLEQKNWVGYVAQTFNGNGNAIDYLARYVFRTAISNARIVNYDGKNVTFLVRDNDHPGQRKPFTLDAREFIRRYLSHVLPKGFTRVRFYGILANGKKAKCLEIIHQHLESKSYKPASAEFKKATGFKLLSLLFPDRSFNKCKICGQELRVFNFTEDTLFQWRAKQRTG